MLLIDPVAGIALIVIAAIILSLMARSWSIDAKRTPQERALREQKKAEQQARLDEMLRRHQGFTANTEVVCPQCQQKGHVHTRPIKQKVGISGGKATAAVLTGGVSMLATGLSRKQAVTEAQCLNCKTTWHF